MRRRNTVVAGVSALLAVGWVAACGEDLGEPGMASAATIIGEPITDPGPGAVCPETGTITDGSDYPWNKEDFASGTADIDDWGYLEWGSGEGLDGNQLNYDVGEGIVDICIKGGPGYTIYRVTGSGTIYYEFEGDARDISHISWRIVEEPPMEANGEWCSPGYWRNHLDEAAFAAEQGGFSLESKYSEFFGAVTLTPLGERQGAPTDPTLLEVLQNPQWYGGEAFNDVGDLLSDAHPDVDFQGERVEDSCPL